MCGADGVGLDPLGVSVALCPVAFSVSLQKETCDSQTPVQALPLQAGNAQSTQKKHNTQHTHKKNQINTWSKAVLEKLRGVKLILFTVT